MTSAEARRQAWSATATSHHWLCCHDASSNCCSLKKRYCSQRGQLQQRYQLDCSRTALYHRFCFSLVECWLPMFGTAAKPLFSPSSYHSNSLSAPQLIVSPACNFPTKGKSISVLCLTPYKCIDTTVCSAVCSSNEPFYTASCGADHQIHFPEVDQDQNHAVCFSRLVMLRSTAFTGAAHFKLAVGSTHI